MCGLIIMLPFISIPWCYCYILNTWCMTITMRTDLCRQCYKKNSLYLTCRLTYLSKGWEGQHILYRERFPFSPNIETKKIYKHLTCMKHVYPITFCIPSSCSPSSFPIDTVPLSLMKETCILAHLKSTYEKNMWYLPFWVWFILLNIMMLSENNFCSSLLISNI